MYWRCLSYVHMAVHPTKKMLLISLDETSVYHAREATSGLVVCRQHWGSNGTAPASRAKKGGLRGAVAYVATICNESEIQACLPHFLVGSKPRFTLKLLRQILPRRPKNCHAWREASSWNTKVLMVKMLPKLAHALLPWKEIHQPVIVLDVAPCHTHKLVLQHARKLGLQLIFVPARLRSSCSHLTRMLLPLSSAG